MMDSITDVPKIKVGHAHNLAAATGCTVVICESGAVAGVDVRGGAPGTRETDLMNPGNLVEKVHAIYLSGGSAFGLDGASGVVRYLEEKGIGFDTGVAKVPIVPGAVLFDLSIGDSKIRPDSAMGYEACLNISDNNSLMGNVGAGAGATIGKILGDDFAMKGGLGTASVKSGELVVGALVAVNCLGDIIDIYTGKLIAGALNKTRDGLISTIELMKRGVPYTAALGTNTTIGVIATNARLSKAEAHRVAFMAHDGYARAINPVHTMFDGDTIFCMAIGEVDADISTVGALAADTMARAIVKGVKAAESLYGRISYKDLLKIYR